MQDEDGNQAEKSTTRENIDVESLSMKDNISLMFDNMADHVGYVCLDYDNLICFKVLKNDLYGMKENLLKMSVMTQEEMCVLIEKYIKKYEERKKDGLAQSFSDEEESMSQSDEFESDEEALESMSQSDEFESDEEAFFNESESDEVIIKSYNTNTVVDE